MTAYEICVSMALLLIPYQFFRFVWQYLFTNTFLKNFIKYHYNIIIIIRIPKTVYIKVKQT